MAGGLNLYGYANGDPVNFSDPFGLCVDGVSTLACLWAVVEIGATIADVADLAVTGVQYLRGHASGRDLGITAAGVGAGIVGLGGGYGRAGRIAARRATSSLDNIGHQIDNIAGRLDRAHLSAARLENTGRLSTGFDHVQEVTDWANGLRNSIRRLNGILGDPNLDAISRRRAEGLLSRASRALDAAEEALR